MKKILSPKVYSNLIKLSFTLLLAFMFFSCGSKLIPIKYGNITTPGVVITADDGSFKLVNGETWTPPFYTIADPSDMEHINNKTTSKYNFALEMHAKKVKVKTPYLDKELYGVLMFNRAIKGCESPATRSYQISIPEQYVIQAQNGQVSVLYEYYDCGKLNAKSWILWLSDVPF